MDVSSIISKSRIQTWTSVGQKSDVLMLQDLNTVYGNIFSTLNSVSKKYTWQTYKTASVANQSEYNIPKGTVSDTGLQRVLNVSIKYSSNGDYIPIKMYDTSHPIDNDYTNENIPYCIQRDDSIFIYPTPSTSITDWIIIEGNYIPLALELTTVSDNIKLAPDNHDILLYGLNAWNFGDKQLFDKQIIANNMYTDWLKTLLWQWGMDIESGYYEQQADLSQRE